jgi:hypothetical protein
MFVKEWLSGFIVSHQARHPRDDWPVEGCGSAESRLLWCQWLEALIAVKAKPAEAEAASCEINGRALARWEDHLGAIIGGVKRLRERKPPEPASLAGRSIASLREDERIAEAQRAIAEAGKLTMLERREMANRLIDELYDLGWEFVWMPDDKQFKTFRTEPDAPQPDIILSTRLRALKAEVYALLGHPLPGERPLPRGECRPRDWRQMIGMTAEGMAVIGADL